MYFEIQGPYEIPRVMGLIDNSARSKKMFWATVSKDVPNLPEACGCYIFTVKATRGALPWYVGRTTKRTFKHEALGSHQVNHYNQALGEKVGVKPQLFFIAKQTPSGRPAKPSQNSHKDIEFRLLVVSCGTGGSEGLSSAAAFGTLRRWTTLSSRKLWA